MNIERLKRDIVDELFANPGASLDDYLRRNSAYRDVRAFVKGWFDTISRNFDHFKGLMERFRDDEPAQFDRSAKDFESRFRAFKQWAMSKEPSLAGNRELDTAWARHLFSKIPDRLGTITIS